MIVYIWFFQVNIPLPYKVIQDKFLDLIKSTSLRETILYIACNMIHAFVTSENHKYYTLRSSQKLCQASSFILDNISIIDNILFGIVLNYAKSVGICRRVQTVPPYCISVFLLLCNTVILPLSHENQTIWIEALNSTSWYWDALLYIE